MSKSKQKKGEKTASRDGRLVLQSLNLYATFYPKYYLLETTLKNRLYTLVKQQLGESWFADQLTSSSKDSIFKLEESLILRRKPKGFVLKDNGLLVESGFGIWVELFNRQLYKELKGVPILIFTKLPSNIKRKELYQLLSKVKELRNQLFHYRIPPVVDVVQLKDIDKLVEVNNDLMHLLQWLDVAIAGPASKEFEKKVAMLKKALS